MLESMNCHFLLTNMPEDSDLLMAWDREAKGIPIGRPAEVNLRNNHTQYIFTWLVLAQCELIVPKETMMLYYRSKSLLTLFLGTPYRQRQQSCYGWLSGNLHQK